MKKYPLTNLIQIDACRIGEGSDQCRFLAKEGTDMVCVKRDPHLAEIVNLETGRYVAFFKMTNKKDHGLPVGDNCPGHMVGQDLNR